ncbi:MAG: bifunctional folylpolyglutamate synthase/dihydrofolate synthase [Alphaproteobacteria bacterium]|nr:bifunctional folylpolyglutamate synthase/dihydrofolate synthase [Alphaproteobacteria bacterium]
MRLHPKVIDLTLGRIEALLADLGHPERALPPIVHVAGTNGKGSVVADLMAMYRAAGLRAHAYTSPHLVRFGERIVLAGDPIPEPDLVALLDEVEAINGERPITFFEITTAVAYLAFSRVPADVLLLEVGLGGRLDATNVITPDVSVITPVSLDHMQFLGPDIPSIAAEKAGILKPGIPAVIGPQRPEALTVIEEKARTVGAPLSVHGRDWTVDRTADGFALDGVPFPRPALIGDHQIDNAAVAVMAAKALGDRVPALALPDACLAEGIATARWPARLQRLTAGPLVEVCGGGTELWLDGGHNEAAAAVIAGQLDAWAEPRTAVIVGMLESKEPVAFFRKLAGKVAAVKTIAIPEEKATLSADAVAEKAGEAGLTADPCPDIGGALRALLDAPEPPRRVLICGSLYLAGRVLRDNG